MPRKVTRRKILEAGAASAGMFLGTGCGSDSRKQNAGREQIEKGPGREPFWNPGPDKNLVRNLTPGPTPVRMGIYLHYEEDTDFDQMIKDFLKVGGTIRLTGAVTRPDGWNTLSTSRLNEFIDVLNQYDIELFEVAGYCNILHYDESVRQKNLAHLAQCIEFADRVGCRTVGTISGSRSPIGIKFIDNYNVHPDNWTLETWELLVSGIKQVFKDTAGMKAAIGMEAQVTTNIDGPLAHRRLIDDVGDERMKVVLDPINMISLHNYFHTTELINECFDLLGEDIMVCHGKDTYVLPHSQTVHVQEVCTGRGIFDFESYLVRLSRMKWARTLWPDHIPDKDLPEAFAYIKKIAEKVGVTIYG